MAASEPTVSMWMFGALVLLYACISVFLGSLLSRKTRQAFEATRELQACTSLLIEAHRDLKRAGATELTARIERYMRKRLHNARSIEVTT